MSIVFHHKDNHKVGGKNPLAVSKRQFCVMFYHVTERKRDKISFKCLKQSKCRVGSLNMTKQLHANPRARAVCTLPMVPCGSSPVTRFALASAMRKTKRLRRRLVVVYVRLIDRMGRLIFHARYGNCFQGKNRKTIHAEHFMLVDKEFNQAVKFLRDQKGGKIEMYMNKQPCFRSTRPHRKKSRVKRKECARELIDFYNFYCSSHGRWN